MSKKKAFSIGKECKKTKSKVVLIVESNLIFIRAFSKILLQHDGENSFSIKVSENVEEILLLAASGKIDVILMDVVLPNSTNREKPTDGLSIARLLKSNPRTASIPVLLISAYSKEGHGQSFLATSGAEAYISQPILNPQAFADTVAKYAANTFRP